MYKEVNVGWLKHFDFQILDIISLELAFFLAFITRHGLNYSHFSESIYQAMFFVLALVSFVTAILLQTFKNVLRRGYYREAVVTLKQTLLVMRLSLLFAYSVKESNVFSRIVLFLTGFYYFFISYCIRRLWRNYLINKNASSKTMIILISTYDEAPRMVQRFEDNYYDAIIKGVIIVDCSAIGESINGYYVLADKKTSEQYIKSHWVDEVFFGTSVDRSLLREMEEVFLDMGITTHHSLIESESERQFKRRVEDVGGYTVLTRSIRILSFGELMLKRLIDLIGGLVGSLITLVLFVVIAPAIYIASPGPLLFSQTRVGKNGKYFTMYKFRSMYPDAEKRKEDYITQNTIPDGYMFKLDSDPRIIGSKKGKGIGHFIRRTSIDEFPQFFNVLKGDMSLVGTRPPTVEEWHKYEKHHRARLATKPGITGMWQISGRSNITSFEDVVKLDMEYIENWSIGLDIKILVKTIVQVLKGTGAK